MHRTLRPYTLLAPFLTLLLFSCEYEEKEAQLSALVTEVRFLQRDVSDTQNAVAASIREEKALLQKYKENNAADEDDSPLEEQLKTAHEKLATTKATYEELTLEIQSYKETYSLEDVTVD